jgi:hypothetical protein
MAGRSWVNALTPLGGEGSLLDHRLRGRVNVFEQRLDLLTGAGIDREIHLHRFRPQVRIRYRRVECPAQEIDPIRGRAGRGKERPSHAQRRRPQRPDLPLLLGLRNIEHRRDVAERRDLVETDLDEDADLPVAQPFGIDRHQRVVADAATAIDFAR